MTESSICLFYPFCLLSFFFLAHMLAQEHPERTDLGLFDCMPSNIQWQLMGYLHAKARGCFAATSKAIQTLVEAYGRHRGPVCVLCGTFAHPILDSIRLDMGMDYGPSWYETSPIYIKGQENHIIRIRHTCSVSFTQPRERRMFSAARLLAVRVHTRCVSALGVPTTTTASNAIIVSKENEIFIRDNVLEPVRSGIAATAVARVFSKHGGSASPIQMYNSIGIELEQQDIDPEQTTPLDAENVCMILRNISRLSYVLEFVTGNNWFEDKPTLMWSDKLIHIEEASVKRK